MAQLRAEHVALSKQLEQAPQPHGFVSPHIKVRGSLDGYIGSLYFI